MPRHETVPSSQPCPEAYRSTCRRAKSIEIAQYPARFQSFVQMRELSLQQVLRTRAGGGVPAAHVQKLRAAEARSTARVAAVGALLFEVGRGMGQAVTRLW